MFAAVILPAGLLGDRYGRKRLLLVGLILFALASAACAATGSPGVLIAARAALGLGGALVTVLSFSALPVLFSPQERPKALGVLAGAAFVAYPIGPLLGGWLLANYWWGWVFLVNVPVVVAALIAVSVFLEESRSPTLEACPDRRASLICAAVVRDGTAQAYPRPIAEGPLG